MGIVVGIATRNAEEVLPGCLRSLISQTTQPDKYVICIGPSDDRTEELIQEFVDQITVPTKIIYDKDGIGTSYARKVIVENCTQEHIVWADSDFIFPPNYIEAVVEIVEKDDFDFLEYPTFDNIISLNEATRMEKTEKLPDPINIQSVERIAGRPYSILIVRRGAVMEVGNYDPYFIRGQGLELTVRLRARGYKGVRYSSMNVYHIWGDKSVKKSLTRAVYFRFLYKYGIDYMFLGGKQTEHLAAFLLRSCVVFSLPLLGLCYITGLQITVPLLMLMGGCGALVGGLTLNRRLSLTSCINQFVKCFGEYYLLYKILTDKNRPKRGYGNHHLRSSGG